MTAQALQQSLRQQALALCLSAAVTAAMLSGMVGLAGNDQAALMAMHQLHSTPTVAAVVAQPAV
jgi:uncharacterized protein YgfB (UPF0149 family)